jgi:tripartite ATP-independent transporter DctM subunit
MRHKIESGAAAAENAVASISLILIAILPALELVLRLFQTGVRGQAEYVKHLVLWLTFAGGLITSREGRHLALTAGMSLIGEPAQSWIRAATSAVSVAVSTALTVSSYRFVTLGFVASDTVGALPANFVLMIMPVGFALLAVRFVVSAPAGIRYRLTAASGALAAWLLGYPLSDHIGMLIWPCSIVLVAGALLGMPVFVTLGGLAALLFLDSAGMIAVVPNEAYTMLTGAVIPTIPLFTLAGFILSESKAGERLVALFRATFGWLPGGLAIVATLVCAFFTTFTGASGVTILALGALLAFILVENRYPRPFSVGLLTGSGSIGLLFPPSLPIILYSVVSNLSMNVGADYRVDIKQMFVGGLIPGVLMVGTVAALGVRTAIKSNTVRKPFDPRGAVKALGAASGEILLPLLIIVMFFSGYTTLVETAAVAVVFALVLETLIHRDIAPRDLPGVLTRCVPMIGGVLIILAIARGLSYYIIDAQIPMQLAEWTRTHVQSKYVFLLVLNLALLVTGCFMDIFSAIMVVVPLILPIGQAFGIHPVHLGIIFLANLELGYMTPPVGINLFLSSFRFEEPLVRVYRHVLPFLIALLITVLLITYVPWLTTGLLSVFGLE